MGKNNRARRAAKAKQRARERAGQRASTAHGVRRGPGSSREREDPGAAGRLTDEERAGTAWLTAAGVAGTFVSDRRAAFVELERLPGQVVLAAAERLLLWAVAGLWGHGWQPHELHRHARIGRRSAGATRLLELAVAVDCARRLDAHEQLHPSWRQQAVELAAHAVGAQDGWLGRWLGDLGLETAAERNVLVAEALPVLLGLPPLDVLVPPPGGSAPAGSRSRTTTSDPVLRKVRNLLAKAESTDFEAEAIALTAKAHELITRHAIDSAVLSGESIGEEEPTSIRVPIDPPYADAKAVLLQTVASATRCRAVFAQQLSLSHVIGFETDLAAMEVLFTSLLVQAQQAMAAAARSAAPGTLPRGQSFRSAFLQAYGARIGERLDEVNEHVFGAAADESGRFLPVLRSQQDAVEDAVAARFGALGHGRVRGGYDASGWASGRLAADMARLNAGDLDSGH